MSVREQVTREPDNLSGAELKQVAECVAFLKFRTRLNQISTLDEAQLSALYSEFADEDGSVLIYYVRVLQSWHRNSN